MVKSANIKKKHAVIRDRQKYY